MDINSFDQSTSFIYYTYYLYYCLLLWVITCVFSQLISLPPAAIGDLDGDGRLDMVVLMDYLSEASAAWTGEYIPYHTTTISKVNLETNLAQPTLTPIQAKTLQNKAGTTLSHDKVTAVKIDGNYLEKSLSSVGFKPLKQQPWTQYMGTLGDSVYNGHHGNVVNDISEPADSR